MASRALPLFFVAAIAVLPPGCSCDGAVDQPTNNSTNNGGSATNNGTDSQCDACREDQRCVERPDGTSVCACPAGTSEDGGACVADTACGATTCNGHGDCMDTDSGPVCSCELGWAGGFCDECDEVNGWTADGLGGCTDDPCSTIQCPERVCRVTDGVPSCECPPGTHDEEGECLPDTECLPTSCNEHGSCDDSTGSVVCTCDSGWGPPTCAMCDELGGYHDDGDGGCTMDPCLPNPCTAANMSVCEANATGFVCKCDPGYHEDAGVCVEDETCIAGVSCNGHGTCDDSTGVVSCACDPGYTGAACDACDAVAGYHDDGAGGCTTDVCLPNPCTATANKSVCASNGMGGFTCQCDAGFHDDGAGGCTTDVCLPNPCTAMNQACRDNGGMPECYTPDCDDQNPCTDDSRVNGVCQNTPVTDGTACATSPCRTGEMCTTGVCGGGGARVCHDSNPCTDDTCDPAAGCVFADDDTNVPDDGVGCTDDTCSGGFENHTANAANCDDALYCNGDEVCAPTDQAADAEGCVSTNVPVPPADPGPCATYGTCDESTDSFPLVNRADGDPCDDGLACTSGDTCDATGSCRGTAVVDCGGPPTGACASTTPLPSVLDVPVGAVTNNVTVDGQPLAATGNDTAYNNLYAVARDTGTRHPLAMWYWTSGSLYGPRYGERLVPGIYDILYVRGTTGSAETYVYRTDTSDALPNGVRVLQSGVYVYAGQNVLDVDLPVADVSLSVTVDGQPLAATGNDTAYNNLYAVAKDTGTRHPLAMWYWTGGALYGPQYGERLVAGTYDIVYVRGTTGSSEQYVYRTDSTDTLPNGVRVLMEDVVFAPGQNSLTVDIPVSTVTTNVTVDGQPLAATGNDTAYNNLYAVARDTGTRHPLAMWYWTSGSLYGPRYGERLVDGVYDIVYVRGTTGSSEQYVYRTDSSDALPNGVRVVKAGVVISGDTTLDVDILTSDLTVNVTIDGQPLAATGNDTAYNNLYAVAKDTGTRHPLAMWYWTSGSLYGPNYGERLVAGTYDILYVRGTTGSSEQYVYRTDTTDALPNGVVYVAKDVTVSAGAQTLDIDIPVADVAVDITVDGQPLAATGNDTAYNNLYAVNTDTGTRHPLAMWYWTSGALYGPRYGERLVAGTYDIIYVRGTTGSTEQYVYRTDTSDMLPNAVVYLRRGVSVGPGSVLSVEIPVSAPTYDVWLAGQPLPLAGNDTAYNNLYAVSRATGTRHPLAMWYWTSGALYGPRFGERYVRDAYDILYVRGTTGSSETYVYRTDATDMQPNGVKYVAECVELP